MVQPELSSRNPPQTLQSLGGSTLPPPQVVVSSNGRVTSELTSSALAGSPVVAQRSQKAAALRYAEPRSFRGIQVVGYLAMFLILLLGPILAIGLAWNWVTTPTDDVEKVDKDDVEDSGARKTHKDRRT